MSNVTDKARQGSWQPANSQPADVSVVIPVKNEAAGIAACLAGILAQTIPVREIIVIDSGSTDGTQAIARTYPKVRLIEIASSEFNHGDTRNLGVQEARGDFIVFTVGDARPASNDWIELMLAGFTDDDVVAVSGAQVVPEDKSTNPLEWFRPQSPPQVKVFRFADASAFHAAEPETKWRASSLDNVTSMYRRRALIQIPFRRIVYGEDAAFALDALSAGYAIGFNPAARIYHFHLQNYTSLLKRTIVAASQRYQSTGYLVPQHRFIPTFARGLVRLVRERKLTWTERLHWARYNFEAGRALRDGTAKVRAAERKGDDAMRKLCEAYAGTPPIPVKPVVQAEHE